MKRHITRWAVTAWLLTVCLMSAAVSAEPVKFSIAADTRGALGFVDVMNQLKAAGGPGLFLLTPGDMDPAETTRAQIDTVFGPSLVWYPVLGNHETESKNTMSYVHDYFDKRLKDKVVPGPQGTQQTTYSFDVGDVHITVINLYWNGKPDSDSDTKTKDVVLELRDWLKNDLSTSSKPWKIVVGHEPAFPQPDRDWNDARHIGDSLDRHKESRDAFWKLLDEQGVAAYICGHTHRYSRYQPKGSKVWQIDTAQARGDKDWKFDAFIIVTADKTSLKFDVYRDLLEKGKFAISDMLAIPARK